MRKILSIILSIILLFVFVGCKDAKNREEIKLEQFLDISFFEEIGVKEGTLIWHKDEKLYYYIETYTEKGDVFSNAFIFILNPLTECSSDQVKIKYNLTQILNNKVMISNKKLLNVSEDVFAVTNYIFGAITKNDTKIVANNTPSGSFETCVLEPLLTNEEMETKYSDNILMKNWTLDYFLENERFYEEYYINSEFYRKNGVRVLKDYNEITARDLYLTIENNIKKGVFEYDIVLLFKLYNEKKFVHNFDIVINNSLK